MMIYDDYGCAAKRGAMLQRARRGEQRDIKPWREDALRSIHGTRIRTLVVDDSPFMLKALAQILKQTANFDLVGTATNGCQALRQVSALSPDLVLMDVHLPCLNGLQATQHIKQRERPPVVVIITSDTFPVTKELAEKAGADGFLAKNADLRDRLLEALKALFGPPGATRAVPRSHLSQGAPVRR